VTFTTRPELSGTFGMVASTHWLATAAGMAVLERGGNAFDAAVATGLALQVVEPHLNGPGGEVPVLLWDAREERARVLCGQGPMPALATRERLLALGVEEIPGTGLLPAAVPGAFDAWMLLLRDLGSLPLRDVLGYAIGCAEQGFPAVPRLAETIAAAAPLFAAHWPSSAELWLAAGRAPRPGARLRNPVLARTYRRLLAEAEAAGRDRGAQIEAARDAYLRGFVAEAIVRYVDEAEVLDATGERHGGLLRAEDLAGFAATWEAPVTLAHAGWTVCKTGPWGQGPVLLQQLALLEGAGLEGMGRGSAPYLHTLIEGAKLAFADRDAHYGDAAPVPLAALLSPDYAARRRALVGEEASDELRPGSPDGVATRFPPFRWAREDEDARAGEPTLSARAERSGDTCHLDVADRHGNVVSATPSGGWLQSSPAIPGLGFCLGTRGQMTWLAAGLPSTLAPGRRPRTTLTPSLALHEDGTRLAFGTPGGDQQDQWSLAFFLAVARFGLDLQAAIDAPAFHTTHLVSSFAPRVAERRRVEVESRVGPEVVAGLRRRGHDVHVADPWSLGRLSAVARDPDGTLRAAANPRGMQGYAAGR
jgi:gamma-glutamyltranspeptidase/glutathione hydrolase